MDENGRPPRRRLVPAFDEADVRRWETAFEMQAPGATDRPATACPAVVSLRGQDSPCGIGLRMRFADGSETDVLLNAVAARALAIRIRNTGISAGWMPDIMVLTPPLVPAPRPKVP